MTVFFIGAAQFVEAESAQDALKKVVEAYKPLKADDRPAYAIAADPDDEWAQETYEIFRAHNAKKHPE